MFAKRPLKLKELYFAVLMDIGQLDSAEWDPSESSRDSMEAFILASSRGLIELRYNGNGDKRMLLIHESVREFLLAGGLTALCPFSDMTVAARSHLKLFTCCQAYLRFDLPSSQRSGSRRWFKDAKTYPLLGYAADHVLDHPRVSHAAGLVNLSDLSDFPIRTYSRLRAAQELQFKEQPLDLHRHPIPLLHVLICQEYHELVEALLTTTSALPFLADGPRPHGGYTRHT